MIGAIIGISSVLIAVITLVKLLTFYKKHSSTSSSRSGLNSSVINTSMSMTSNSSTTTRIAPDSSISLHSLPPESQTTSPSSTFHHHLNQTPSLLPSSKLVSNPNHKLRSNQRQSNSLVCSQM